MAAPWPHGSLSWPLSMAAWPPWLLHGRSPAYGEGISFWALGEMVRGRCGLLETDDLPTTRAKVAETLAEHVPDRERAALDRARPAGAPGDRDSNAGAEQLFAAWRTFFERLAATAPVVMVFEDFHFADAGLIDFVDHVMEWSRNVPIYVVTLSRPELLEKRPNWGAGKRNFTSLYLEPLTGSGDARAPRRAGSRAARRPAVKAIVGARRRDPAVRGRDRSDAPGRGSPARSRTAPTARSAT